MTYEIEFKPRGVKDLEGLPKATQQRIMAKLEALKADLAGDVKRLTSFLARVSAVRGRFSNLI